MKGDLRKDQIMMCAIKLFAKKGYYNTHVEDILPEIRIGKGTFYRYFKSKEELYIAILVRYLDEWEKSVESTLVTMSKKDVIGYYQALIARSLQFFRDHPDLCNIFLRIGPSVNELHNKYVDVFEAKMVQYVIDDLKKGIDAGYVRRDIDIELMANIMLGAHLRVVYNYFVLKAKHKNLPDLEHISEQFFALIYKGLHP
ncbi:MAG: TetR/AcrR family transcriptional regulator [Syntrophaceae bacterium]